MAGDDQLTGNKSVATGEVSDPAPPTSPSFPTHAHHYLSLKLTTSNFLLWKAQVTPFLRGQNLFRFVDGNHPCPQDDAAAAALWRQQDATLMSLLISSIAESVLPIVLSASTSKAIWDALHGAFGSTSSTRILSLHLGLQRLQQKDDEPVVSFLTRAKTMYDELHAAGRPISSEDFNIHVFRGLRTDLQDIVPSLLSRSDPISYTDLQGVLQSHETLKSFQQLAVSDSSPPSANNVASNFQPANPSTVNPGRGQFGARGRGGRGGGRFPRGRGGRGSSDGRMWCSICNRTNHMASNCFYRPPGKFYSPPSNPPAANTYNQRFLPNSTPPVPSHLAAATHLPPLLPSPSNVQPWVADTGSTHHTQPDLLD